MKLIQTKDYLLLIDEEAEIKEEDYYYWELTNTVQINRLLEGDRKLGRTGPKGNVYKTIAYYPLTKEAKKLDLPLLPLVGLETEEGKIWKEDGVFVYLQNGKKYKKSELELWVENT